MPKTKEPDAVSEAEAAATEAQAPDDAVSFEFRGSPFTVPRSIFGSARLLLALASGQMHRVVWETLPDAATQARFLSLVRPGDQMDEVAAEFFEALNAAGGTGNS